MAATRDDRTRVPQLRGAARPGLVAVGRWPGWRSAASCWSPRACVRSVQDRRHQVESSYAEACPFPLRSLPTTLGPLEDGRGERDRARQPDHADHRRHRPHHADLRRRADRRLAGGPGPLRPRRAGPAAHPRGLLPVERLPAGRRPAGPGRRVEGGQGQQPCSARRSTPSPAAGRCSARGSIIVPARGAWSPDVGSGRKFPRRNPERLQGPGPAAGGGGGADRTRTTRSSSSSRSWSPRSSGRSSRPGTRPAKARSAGRRPGSGPARRGRRRACRGRGRRASGPRPGGRPAAGRRGAGPGPRRRPGSRCRRSGRRPGRPARGRSPGPAARRSGPGRGPGRGDPPRRTTPGEVGPSGRGTIDGTP